MSISNTKSIILFILIVITTCTWYTTAGHAIIVSDGLVSYWTFDQSTIEGDTVKGIFGNNDGTIMGKPEVVEGVIGEALHFNGVDDYVEVLSDESLKLQDEFTVETWIKGDSEPDTNSGYSQWLFKGHDDENYSFSWDHAQGEFTQSIAFYTGAEWPVAQIGEVLEGEEWYHIVGTWDGNNLMIYLNGVLSGETKVAGTPLIDDIPLSIGSGTDGGSPAYEFPGAIDEVKIYNRALTADEVLNNFNDNEQLAVVSAATKLPVSWGRIKKR